MEDLATFCNILIMISPIIGFVIMLYIVGNSAARHESEAEEKRQKLYEEMEQKRIQKQKEILRKNFGDAPINTYKRGGI